MAKFVRIDSMTDAEKDKAAKVLGETVLMADEMKSFSDISDETGISVTEVLANMREILFVLKRYLGLKEYLKVIFRDKVYKSYFRKLYF